MQYHCLHSGEEAGAAFAFGMLQPDVHGHVSWDSLTAVTAACARLALGNAPSDDCVRGFVRG